MFKKLRTVKIQRHTLLIIFLSCSLPLILLLPVLYATTYSNDAFIQNLRVQPPDAAIDTDWLAALTIALFGILTIATGICYALVLPAALHKKNPATLTLRQLASLRTGKLNIALKFGYLMALNALAVAAVTNIVAEWPALSHLSPFSFSLAALVILLVTATGVSSFLLLAFTHNTPAKRINKGLLVFLLLAGLIASLYASWSIQEDYFGSPYASYKYHVLNDPHLLDDAVVLEQKAEYLSIDPYEFLRVKLPINKVRELTTKTILSNCGPNGTAQCSSPTWGNEGDNLYCTSRWYETQHDIQNYRDTVCADIKTGEVTFEYFEI